MFRASVVEGPFSIAGAFWDWQPALKCFLGYPLTGVRVRVRLLLIFNKKVRNENDLSNHFRVCVCLRIVCSDHTYRSSISVQERAPLN